MQNHCSLPFRCWPIVVVGIQQIFATTIPSLIGKIFILLTEIRKKLLPFQIAKFVENAKNNNNIEAKITTNLGRNATKFVALLKYSIPTWTIEIDGSTVVPHTGNQMIGRYSL